MTGWRAWREATLGRGIYWPKGLIKSMFWRHKFILLMATPTRTVVTSNDDDRIVLYSASTVLLNRVV